MSSGSDIYIVGLASVYAGAGDLTEFWESILACRQGFREFPQVRLSLADYVSEDREDRDKTYIKQAAFIDGFEFDWKARRVPKSAFEATDPVHWLALTTALKALEDSGLDLDAVGRDRVGVILGNSLTGEVTRAHLLRLRWPYVRQAIADGAVRSGLNSDAIAELIGEVEQSFKSAFPTPNEDTLAGALSNVIAGRICNVLDLGGGGFVVDGACASSLLAVSTACESLASGRLDAAIVGGVDISLDPLEMVGFARTGALATGIMRVYDQDSAGFLPGEGCGMLVLVKGEVVCRLGLKPWANISGWGVSSDGSGGITAPKASAQALAMARCYAKAGFAAQSLDFIEGHGTGTTVGDRQELLGFLTATQGTQAPRPSLRQIGVTSIKTLLGHTKAAAGAAGLIKAVLAANQRVLPPIANLKTPAEAFRSESANIYPIIHGQTLPPHQGLRAGVSGAGFGGINCHIAISTEQVEKRSFARFEAEWLLASAQSAEVFIASADDFSALLVKVEKLLADSLGMAEGELVDLAAAWALQDQGGVVRFAVVAETVSQLQDRLYQLATSLKPNLTSTGLPERPVGVWLGTAKPDVRVGLLLPGQGSQFLRMGNALSRRHPWGLARRKLWDEAFAELGPQALSGYINQPLERADNPEIAISWESALRDTRVSQPAIVMVDLQWLEWLKQMGIKPAAVAGHSLGEVAALVAAGMLSEAEAIALVRVRAMACAADGVEAGAMLALRCGAELAQELVNLTEGYAVVANDNAPDQVVVAGVPKAISRLAELARLHGVETMDVRVSKAFHSKHMAPAAKVLAQLANSHGQQRTCRLPFYSVVLGGLSPQQFDPYRYLADQITAPVRFRQALSAMAESCDVLIETGPGSVLSGLARRTLGRGFPVCALEPSEDALAFCSSIGQLFVTGVDFDWPAFYAARYHRPFIPARQRQFIENPCARPASGLDFSFLAQAESRAKSAPKSLQLAADVSVEEVILDLIAKETGYDLDMIPLEATLSRDLNLDSIKVAELRAELRARGIELADDFPLGNATISEIAQGAKRLPVAVTSKGKTAQASTPLPANLPVFAYFRTWQATTLQMARQAAQRVVVLYAEDQANAAQGLAQQLGRVELDAGSGLIFKSQLHLIRLVVLPPARTATAAVSALFARVGEYVAQGLDSIVFISRGGSAPVFGFAQSLSMELPQLPVLAAQVAADSDLSPLVLAEASAGVGLLSLDGAGQVKQLKLAPWKAPDIQGELPLNPGDVVVVSGGAKGITAECTKVLLKATGARAILLGTSAAESPAEEVRETLEAMQQERLQAVYFQCDVTDLSSVKEALAQGSAHFGHTGIVGIIHGAGLNLPALATRLEAATLQREYAVKVTGMTNLLAAVDGQNLKLCVALGSVIGSLGLPGNSGYALANEALAALLEEYKTQHPATVVRCPAYGVWEEVGMGAKLKVLESLNRQQIAAVPVESGTAWFLRSCGQSPAPVSLVISASLFGLPTWRSALDLEKPIELEFVEERVVHEPEQILISRPHIHPKRDAWLADHCFRGALLFATVQAFAAIGNCAQVLSGKPRVRRFESLEISRPLVASHEADTIIEVDVRRFGECYVGKVGLPGMAGSEPAFALRCHLGEQAPPEIQQTREPGEFKPVAPEVGLRLYDHLLFQGPSFRRIQAMSGLDVSHPILRKGRFTILRESSQAAVPDVFFLDALLQCVQILVPKDLCLPVGIRQVDFYPPAWEAGLVTVEAAITERTAAGYITDVAAYSEVGQLLVRYEGYAVTIVEHYPDKPDADALFKPLAQDQHRLSLWLEGQPELAGVHAALGLLQSHEFHSRRQAEAEQIAQQLADAAIALAWHEDGSPFLKGSNLGVSIAHDKGRLLTVCGEGLVGCDLQSVGLSPRPWSELLPNARLGLWQAVAAAMGDRERAGALVWAIHEALIKAGQPEAPVEFSGLQGSSPQFRLLTAGRIAAGLMELTLAGPSAVAVVSLSATGTNRITHYSRDLELTFKNALPPLKSPVAPVFFDWMGELREEAMSSIRVELAEAFGQAGKGMVTNGSWVKIAGPVPFQTPIRAWVWLERVLESHPSTFELGFQWAAVGADGHPVSILAQASQRLTWVSITPEGHVKAEPFPDFFDRFIKARLPSAGAEPFRPPLGVLDETNGDDPLIWRANGQAPNHGLTRLTLDSDDSHANYVGNLYFTCLAWLAERCCQKALKQLGKSQGGFFATQFRLDHLGEAMPGDRLEAEAKLLELRGNDCQLEFSVSNLSQGGGKIASGIARYRHYVPVTGQAVQWQAETMPLWLLPNSVGQSQ